MIFGCRPRLRQTWGPGGLAGRRQAAGAHVLATLPEKAVKRKISGEKSPKPGSIPRGKQHAKDAFAATYPFHPSLLSVFERKWQALPRFQQTRGVLRLLALWVSNAYQAGFRGAHKDPLIGMGTAPLDDPLFRSAIFEQLGGAKLEGAVTTDICGKKDSHALRLDKEAVDTIRRARPRSE